MTLDRLHDEAVRLLKQRRETPASGRAPIQRALAELIVSARTEFSKSDGRPDIDGRTKAYQRYIRAIFDAAGETVDRAAIMSSLRWHIGQVTRDRFGAERLAEEYGLAKEDPLEKLKERRDDQAALSRALGAQDAAGDPLSDITGLRVAARHVATKARPEKLAALTEDERQEADASLVDIEVVVAALRKRLRGAA